MYNTVKLEKSLYTITGKSFTEALSQLDPDSGYKGTELEGLDAFERQLKRFDIKVSGEGCDRVEKFFISAESAVLFPEYVRRQVKAGMDSVSILPDIAAASSRTDGYDYRAMSVTSTGSETGVAQLVSLPQTVVKLADTSSALVKFARRLTCVLVLTCLVVSSASATIWRLPFTSTSTSMDSTISILLSSRLPTVRVLVRCSRLLPRTSTTSRRTRTAASSTTMTSLAR